MGKFCDWSLGIVFGCPCLVAAEQKNSFGRFPERKRLFSLWLPIS